LRFTEKYFGRLRVKNDISFVTDMVKSWSYVTESIESLR